MIPGEPGGAGLDDQLVRDVDRLERIVDPRRRQPCLIGVHTHVGSQILNVDQLAAAVAPIAELGEFDVYDFGGGLGVRYTYADHPPTLDEYAAGLEACAQNRFGMRPA